MWEQNSWTLNAAGECCAFITPRSSAGGDAFDKLPSSYWVASLIPNCKRIKGDIETADFSHPCRCIQVRNFSVKIPWQIVTSPQHQHVLSQCERSPLTPMAETQSLPIGSYSQSAKATESLHYWSRLVKLRLKTLFFQGGHKLLSPGWKLCLRPPLNLQPALLLVLPRFGKYVPLHWQLHIVGTLEPCLWCQRVPWTSGCDTKSHKNGLYCTASGCTSWWHY